LIAFLTPREQQRVVMLVTAVLALAALAVLAVSVAYDPAEIAADLHRHAFGLPIDPCPGCGWCGMSRAFSAMSHLAPFAAVDYNPWVLLHYPLTLTLALGGPWLSVRSWRRARRG
jgi:hypothetical protein